MAQRIKARVKQQNTIVAQTVKIGSGLKLGDLSDVDTVGQTDGGMMRFNDTSGNYEISTDLNNENLVIIGGTY